MTYSCPAKSAYLLPVALLLTLFPAPAAADFNDGVQAFLGERYESAYLEFLPLAEKGHAGAQFGLGLLYRNGLGVGKNKLEAIEYYRAAARQGHAKAQYNLAVTLLSNRETEKEAIAWLEIAAQQNVARAQYHLGTFYLHGFHGLKRDLVQAYVWLDVAAYNNFNREKANQYLKEIKKNMQEDQIAVARKQADGWRPHKTGHVDDPFQIVETMNACVNMNLKLDLAIDNIKSHANKLFECLPKKNFYEDCKPNLVQLVVYYNEYKKILEEEWWDCD